MFGDSDGHACCSGALNRRCIIVSVMLRMMRHQDHEQDVGEHFRRVHSLRRDCEMRLPRPRSPEIVSAPRIEQETDGAADAQAGRRSPACAAGNRTRRKHLPARWRPSICATVTKRGSTWLMPPIVLSTIGKERIARAECDLRFHADAEEQDEQRQEYDKRYARKCRRATARTPASRTATARRNSRPARPSVRRDRERADPLEQCHA